MNGNIAAQIIAVGAVPFITRIYSPEAFGLFAIYMAILSVFGKIGTLCYERAILLPTEDDKAANVVKVSFAVLVLLLAIVCVLVFVFNELIADLLGAQDIADWLFLVPLAALLIVTANIIKYWLLRMKQFGIMSWAHVVESAVSAGTKILVGMLMGGWVGGLIGGALLGSFVVVILMFMSARNRTALLVWRGLDKERVQQVAREFKQFPLFASWTALFEVVSLQMLIFFISNMYGVAVLGFYHLAVRMLQQPISTISQSVTKVFFQKASVMTVNQQGLTRFLLKVTFTLFALCLIPFAILAIYGEWIFIFVFGDSWSVAGVYAQIMVPWFFFIFISGPAAIIYEVCKRQDAKLIIKVLNTLSCFLVLFVASYLEQSATVVIAAYVGVNVLSSLVQILVAIRIAFVNDQKFLVL
jgi:lipopolysaccharide exporter